MLGLRGGRVGLRQRCLHCILRNSVLSAFLAFSATEWILFEKPYLWARLRNALHDVTVLVHGWICVHLCTCVCTCVCDQVIVMSSVLSYESLSYPSYTLGEYAYPHWANVTGWLIAASSMITVPILAVYQLITLPGHHRQVRA